MKMPQLQTSTSVLSYGSNNFIVLILLISAVNPGWCLDLFYPSFPQEVQTDFIKSGESYIVNQTIKVTMDIRGDGTINNLSGRVMYKNPIKLWNKGRVASFNSTFVLNVTPESDPPGDGLAFILTDENMVPDNSMGQWLGIVNASTNGSSVSSIVAVEFDTKKSFPEDLDNNHVGVNINSINSIKQTSLNSSGLTISNGKNLTAMILYNGATKTMNVSVFQGNLIGVEPPVLSIPDLNLPEYLPEKVYVGFSGSTGRVSVEHNSILEWNFTIEDIGGDSAVLKWFGIILCLIIVVIIGGLGVYLCCQRTTPLSQRLDIGMSGCSVF